MMSYSVHKSAKDENPFEIFLGFALVGPHSVANACQEKPELKDHPWVIREQPGNHLVYESAKAIELREKEMNESKADTRRNGNTKPEKPGVYKVYLKRGLSVVPHFAYWTGSVWTRTSNSIVGARCGTDESEDLKNCEFTWELVEMDQKETQQSNPEKPGVYKVFIVGHRNPYYSRWNGKNWLYTCTNEESARQTGSDSISDDLKKYPFTWEPIEMDGTTADDWHNKDEKPMIVGTYEIKIKLKDCSETKETKEYSYWNGEYWYCAMLSPEQAKESSSISGSLYSNEFEWQWKLFEADKFTADEETKKEPMEQATPKTSTDFLKRAIELQAQRAKLYDKDGEKERSMAKTVCAFNAICGDKIIYQEITSDDEDGAKHFYLTESQGWLFMCLLKMVRCEAKAEPHADSIEDLVSYASLYAEARVNGK